MKTSLRRAKKPIVLCCLVIFSGLLDNPVHAANVWERCQGIISLFTGSPPSQPQNPPSAPGTKGYPVLELAADVRQGCLTWTRSGGWTYVENAYRRKLDTIITGPANNRRVRMETFDYEPMDTAVLNYVIRMDGTIILGRESGPQIYRDYDGKIGKLPHSTLASEDGSIQRVRAAGQLRVSGGKIVAIDIQSGHYKPGEETIPFVEESFRRYPEILAPNFVGVIKAIPRNRFGHE